MAKDVAQDARCSGPGPRGVELICGVGVIVDVVVLLVWVGEMVRVRVGLLEEVVEQEAWSARKASRAGVGIA